MQFEFATAGRILFGPGSRERIREIARAAGERVFLITGRSGPDYAAVAAGLQEGGHDLRHQSVSGEPDVPIIGEALEAARLHKPQLVVAIGGGSVIDLGKVVAALLTNTGELTEYLEVVGEGRPITERPVQFCAVPTTAGTGAEVTRNAVIGVPEHRVKVSMRSPLLLPSYAVVDPELSAFCPPFVTATAGLDACTQLIESYVGAKANPLTDGICREGMVRVGRSLRTAYHDPSDTAAREDMALAALMSGLGLANAKLGAVHGLAGPLGGLVSAPHGALCARMLAPVTRVNLAALRARASESEALMKYRQAAQLLTGRSEAQPDDLVNWVAEIVEEFSIPTLGALGLTDALIPEAVEKGLRASSMQGNPVQLKQEELAEVLQQAL